MDKVISKIISDAAKNNGVDVSTAEAAYMDIFRFIKSKVEGVNFDEIITKEDFDNAKVNFNIPRIFKLYTSLNRINYAREAIRKGNSTFDEGASIDNSIKTSKAVESDSDWTDGVVGDTEGN